MNPSTLCPPPDPFGHQARFLERFARRTLIVHAGFPAGWFEELLKQPGGGGHFRVDLRIAPGQPPTPIEWVVHGFIAPLELPLPLLVRVDREALYIRHLVKNGTAAHPSEILWMLDDILDRYHARLQVQPGHFAADLGIPVSDNRIETPYGSF